MHKDIREAFNPLVPSVAKFPTESFSLLRKENHYGTLLYKLPINLNYRASVRSNIPRPRQGHQRISLYTRPPARGPIPKEKDAQVVSGSSENKTKVNVPKPRKIEGSTNIANAQNLQGGFGFMFV